MSELVNGTTLLGAIPVDLRDRIVHPLIAVLGALALVTGRRQAAAIPRHPARDVPATQCDAGGKLPPLLCPQRLVTGDKALSARRLARHPPRHPRARTDVL